MSPAEARLASAVEVPRMTMPILPAGTVRPVPGAAVTRPVTPILAPETLLLAETTRQAKALTPAETARRATIARFAETRNPPVSRHARAMPGAAVLGRAAATLGHEVRRCPALSVALAVAGLGVVAVSVFGARPAAPEFRRPPAAATPTPAGANVSAAAAHSGLAPFGPPDDAATRGEPSARAGLRSGRPGSPSPVRSAGTGTGAVPPGETVLPAGPAAAARAGVSSTVSPTNTGAAEKSASISFAQPHDGETVTATTTVTGYADMPEDHQVWLLWRHGPGAAYQVQGACSAIRTFTCGSATLEPGGDDTFQLTALVVDPATATTLSAGQSRNALPEHLGRTEITVRRAAP